MKISLINPFVDFPEPSSLGLLYIAAVLERAGYEVSVNNIHDYEWKNIENTPQRYIEKLVDKSTDLIGFTCLTPQFPKYKFLARQIKEKFPEIPIVVGGVHPTALPYGVLRENETDFIVIGEGEETMLEFCERLNEGRSLQDCRGIGYKQNNGELIINPPRPLIQNLDSLPFPARHLIPYDKYITGSSIRGYWSNRGASTMVSRGCPFNCIYCSSHLMFGRKVRYRSPQNVILEIKQLKDEYKIDSLWFMDDTFTVNKKYVTEFCDLLREEGIDIKWSCQSRVDTVVDKELLHKMKKAGCVQIELGVESGSDKVLKALKKGFTVSQVVLAFKLIKEAGIRPLATFMLGNPSEDYSDIRRTRDLVKQIKPAYAQFFITTPYPGTELYSMAIENGWLKTEDYSKFWVTSHESDATIMEINFTAKELKRLQRELGKTVYIRNYIGYFKYSQFYRWLLKRFFKHPISTFVKIFKYSRGYV